MTDFYKRRTEADTFAVDFTARLDTSEALTGTPTVRVARSVGGVWDDVSTEFETDGTLDAVIALKQVQFGLGVAASADAQAGGNYVVQVSVSTDALRVLTEVVPLVVDASGDPLTD
jgi:hypothetical protein